MNRKSINKTLGIACTGVLICLAVLVSATTALAVADNADCLMCHSAKTLHKTSSLKQIPLYVDPKGFASSSHGKLNCIECHTDLKNQPLKHKADVAPVECARCHEKKGWNPNTIHYAVKKDKTPPDCQSCHGSHYIKPKKDPASQTNPAHADASCAECHLKSKAVKTYLHGVHSEVAGNGRPAAGCVECHRPHSGQPAESPISCAECHVKEFKAYASGSHGKAFLSGNTDVPTCVTCHGTHKILRKGDPMSATHTTSEPMTCAKCHDDEKKMAPYGLPTDRLKTYRHSYHGVANKYGDEDVATCAGCHGAHEVLASSNPKSMTHKANLPQTCGQCHKGMLKKVAQGQAHVVITDKKKDSLFWISFAFKWLTIGTMTALCGHIMLDLSCKIRHACRFRRRNR